MGFLAPAAEAPVVGTVATLAGSATVESSTGSVVRHAKARLFVLEDRTAVLVLPAADGRSVIRTTYDVIESAYVRATKTLSIAAESGELVALDGKGCGCGLGVVGSAGPIDGAYRLTRVRAPEWHTAS